MYELVDDLTRIARGLRALPDSERLVILMRFERDMTQSEIGAERGLSQMHVSSVLWRVLNRVRTMAAGDPQRSPIRRLG